MSRVRYGIPQPNMPKPYCAIPLGPEHVVARILLRIPKAPIGWLSAEATLAGLRTLGRKKPR